MKTFAYLGSTLAEYGKLDAEVTHRVQSGWKRVSGVLCDGTINVKIKWNVYRTVVTPALVYGAEKWALKNAQEKIEYGRNANATMDVRSYKAGKYMK